MIRQITSLLFVLVCSYSWAIPEESYLTDYYYIVSDKASNDVPEGKCLVKGRVTNGYTDAFIKKGLISNFTRSSFTYTNDTGYYEMYISAKDTGLFFYNEKYKEIVCWSYAFKSGHVVEMNWVTSEKLPEGVIEVQEKPVIYLYPEKEMKVEVKLDEALNLTSTYPVYNGVWNVSAKPDGTLESNGRTYPYLFWEGETDNLKMNSSASEYNGYYINTDSTSIFLEGIMDANGLNSKESADFITYWAPKLKQYNFATVQFLVDEDYEGEVCELNVNPAPDNSKRIYMIFIGSETEDKPSNLVPYNFTKVSRKGFTLIEWGGSDLTTSFGG